MCPRSRTGAACALTLRPALERVVEIRVLAHSHPHHNVARPGLSDIGARPGGTRPKRTGVNDDEPFAERSAGLGSGKPAVEDVPLPEPIAEVDLPWEDCGVMDPVCSGEHVADPRCDEDRRREGVASISSMVQG